MSSAPIHDRYAERLFAALLEDVACDGDKVPTYIRQQISLPDPDARSKSNVRRRSRRRRH
jgi:hypothetical protein